MTTLADLIERHNLSHALIVDDGYDEVPRASDLATEASEWSVFFTDLNDAERVLLAGAYERYDETDTSLLMSDDAFVAAVWGLRGQIRSELWDPVFERYSKSHETELAYLRSLEAALGALSITPVPGTRQLSDAGRTEPLILADLFLGSEQTDGDMGASIARLQRLLEGRAANPPLVILMSRSPRLRDKRITFRDRTGVLGSMFRVQPKEALLDGATLSRTIERLARHRTDALRLASFIETWNVELDEARKRFLFTMRRLDLADYGQIQQLLLEFEGQPLGSYVLDVCDRVLEHEIEASRRTISAAEELNAIDTEGYPPPYIAGSPDLQELLSRVIYQHTERLRVSNTVCNAPVSFGDILIRRVLRKEEREEKRVALAAKRAEGMQDEGAEEELEKDSDADDVLVVMTPACDLVRGGAKRVMMMAGSVEELSPKNWIYKTTPLRTPIVILQDKRRMWIRWDVRDVQTMSNHELEGALAPTSGTHVKLVRLRESHALELQQQLLSSLGRVGLVAQMPASFPVGVQLCSWTSSAQLQVHSTPILEMEGGVCVAGRDDGSLPASILRLSEDACDEILTVLGEVEDVHSTAKAALVRAKSSSSLSKLLEKGLPVPNADKTGWTPIRALTGASDPSSTPILEVVGLVARNPPARTMNSNEAKNAAFVLILTDLLPVAAALSARAPTDAIVGVTTTSVSATAESTGAPQVPADVVSPEEHRAVSQAGGSMDESEPK